MSKLGIAILLLAFAVSPVVAVERIPRYFWLTANDGSILGAVYADFPSENPPLLQVSGIYRDTALKSPMKPRARAMLGEALMAQGDLEGALREYKVVLQLSFRGGLNPHEAETARLNAQTNIGQILMMAGSEAEAEKFLRNAWLETPGFPAFGVALSYFDLRNGRFDEARAILDDSLAMMPQYRTTEAFFAGKLYLNRSAVRQIQGDCAGAKEDYRLAMRYPDTPADLEICPNRKETNEQSF